MYDPVRGTDGNSHAAWVVVMTMLPAALLAVYILFAPLAALSLSVIVSVAVFMLSRSAPMEKLEVERREPEVPSTLPGIWGELEEDDGAIGSKTDVDVDGEKPDPAWLEGPGQPDRVPPMKEFKIDDGESCVEPLEAPFPPDADEPRVLDWSGNLVEKDELGEGEGELDPGDVELDAVRNAVEGMFE